MKKLGLLIIILMLGLSVKAQDGSLFDFQIQKIDSVSYEMNLQLSENPQIQYIQVHFLEEGKLLVLDEASLNKKEDGKYYLYFDGEEKEIFLDNIVLSFTHDFGLLTSPTVIVKLVDIDFNIIDSYQQIID